jgi:hypothetical protein
VRSESFSSLPFSVLLPLLPSSTPTLQILLHFVTLFPPIYSVLLDLRITDIRADIVVTSLGSDEAVEEVYAELFGGQEVCPSPQFYLNSTSFAISTLLSMWTFTESRLGSNSEVTLTDRNKVEKETESFLVEGDDLLFLSIPLPYVPLLFHIRVCRPCQCPIFLAFLYPLRRTELQELGKGSATRKATKQREVGLTSRSTQTQLVNSNAKPHPVLTECSYPAQYLVFPEQPNLPI